METLFIKRGLTFKVRTVFYLVKKKKKGFGLPTRWGPNTTNGLTTLGLGDLLEFTPYPPPPSFFFFF